MSVFLKLRQKFIVFDFLVLFAAADLAQRGVHCQPVKPSRELGIALERFGFSIDRPENVLDHFLGVGGLPEDAMGNVVEVSRVNVEDRLQRVWTAFLQALDEASVVVLCFATTSRAPR